jgi:hypothetical protein
VLHVGRVLRPGDAVPDEVEQAFTELPQAMRPAGIRANRVDFVRVG